ncbi:hypothetical protein EST38_g14263 [Candolleomyces aberdarensis]|uniref:Uncharacterized protein n=1 Tax=Candolleomyces aberdarensis TaxID=2316362 RepID=A0A4Q2CXU7_9AGAR|nr:hypothetical protein EST38_g14263 [Candolleomyces aberdarensis]
MRFITFLLSLLAFSMCVAGFPAPQSSEGPTPPITMLTVGGGEGEPITFPATIFPGGNYRRDGDGTTDANLVARQGPIVSGLIVEGIVQLVGYVLGKIADEKGAREDYTRDFVENAAKQYPGWNWVICHVAHSIQFDGVQGEDWDHDHAEFPILLGTIVYDIYWFKSGTFVKTGDGGWINWAYIGNILSRVDTSDSSTVVFGTWNYIDGATAKSKNLTFGAGDTFILRPDSSTVLRADGPGRDDSVRLRSKKNYKEHVAVAINGEPTERALKRSFGFLRQFANRGGQLDTQVLENCDATINSNIGCPVKFNTPQSYGPAFNQNGGGWYAVERSSNFLKVWFWARNDDSVPREVRESQGSVRPDTWGTPTAFFPDTNCNMDQHFAAHNIIINLTLCGDWAGSVFGRSGCPGNCVDLVNNNPVVFKGHASTAMRVYRP